MLTQKQKDLLLFIHDRLRKGDIAPTFEEMKDHLGLKSKSGIHRLITALVERGYLERLPHRARALEVKKLPQGMDLEETDLSPAAKASREINHVMEQAQKAVTEVPLCGKIAAGTPIEAIQHDGENVAVPADMLGNGEYYALSVEGNSMIRAGIHDNDTVIIRRGDTCRNGDIVVALIDAHEATLKRFHSQGGTVRLIPENEDYEIRELPADRVKIQGLLQSLIRSYN